VTTMLLIIFLSSTFRREDKIIAKAITTLKDTKGKKLQKGVYTMPFEFALPSSLPSSLKFPKPGRAFNGRIMYYLRAELGDFCAEKEFQVTSAPLPSDVVPCLVEPTTHELRSLGVLNKGFLSVGASVENSRVGRGETLRVSLASRNDTSVDLNRVRVKLVELIEYKAITEKATVKVELEKLKDIDLPGLDKTKVSKEEVRRSLRGGHKQDRAAVYRSIYEDLVSRNNRFDIVVPTLAQDTYDGNLITISHYLKITFFTKSLTDNPSTKIPIIIGNSRDREQQQSVVPDRQPNEPIATVIFDEEISDNDTTVEVGSRAGFIPMADAFMLEQHDNDSPEQRPPGPNETTLFPQAAYRMLDPTAPTESMIIDNDLQNVMCDDSTVDSGARYLTPPRNPRLGGSSSHLPQRNVGYSPFQMYNGPGRRERLPSYSYDTESGITTVCDTPQRLGAACPDSPGGNSDVQWTLERLLQELNGSIHDYEVVATKIRDPGYKELFITLTPNQFRSIIGHVSMSHQVQVALLLAKQLVQNSAFTCAHCVGALQKTSDYFRANMVETLLPYCSDLDSNYPMLKEELNGWEEVITARAFETALRR
jgi:hypothetical protein